MFSNNNWNKQNIFNTTSLILEYGKHVGLNDTEKLLVLQYLSLRETNEDHTPESISQRMDLSLEEVRNSFVDMQEKNFWTWGEDKDMDFSNLFDKIMNFTAVNKRVKLDLDKTLIKTESLITRKLTSFERNKIVSLVGEANPKIISELIDTLGSENKGSLDFEDFERTVEIAVAEYKELSNSDSDIIEPLAYDKINS